MAKKKFYGVRQGRNVGVFDTWEEAKEKVEGYAGAEYKGFATLTEAQNYVRGGEEEPGGVALEGLTAYVDGSFNDKSNQYSYGVVLIDKGDIKTLNGIGENDEAAKMRNVAGELRGAMAAMDYAVKNGYKKLTIYHDYAGVGKWALNEWKANLTATDQYKEYCRKIFKKIKVEFVKVKAHSGVTYNEMADKLAREAFDL